MSISTASSGFRFELLRRLRPERADATHSDNGGRRERIRRQTGLIARPREHARRPLLALAPAWSRWMRLITGGRDRSVALLTLAVSAARATQSSGATRLILFPQRVNRRFDMFMLATKAGTRFGQKLRSAVLAAAILAAIATVPATASIHEGTPAPSSPASDAPREKPAQRSSARQPLPGRYIVTLIETADARAVAAVANVSPTYIYEHALHGFAAELNDGQLNALRRNKAVASIEQDQEVRGGSFLKQTLDSTGQPWGIDRIDQRTGLSRSYTYWSSGAYGAGYGVRAYVIDSGIATAHRDFGGRAQNLYDVFGGTGQDCHGHGTHVAGTIGGAMHGVAKSVRLLGIRVLDCANRGSVSGFIAGVDYVRRYAIKPAVANMSVGAPFSSALNTAVTNLVNSGVFVAVAAGNGDINGNPLDACTTSPSSASGTLTVASADWYDTKAYSSNYGSCVDLYAPGVSIRSTWLNGTVNTISGTSMATPHVTGVAALLKSSYGDRSSATINSWILTATTTDAIRSNVGTTPNRILFMNGW